MPEYRTAFPNGIAVPDDPRIPLTPEQLAALFPNKEANGRFLQMIGLLPGQHANPTMQTAERGELHPQ